MSGDVDLTIEPIGSKPERRRIHVRRLYNLGSATRDPNVARPHQDEVALVGVEISFDIPSPRIYPTSPSALTTDTRILVQGNNTSGEVEIVLVMADELLIGVGSDHTDRDLERTSIPWSKQVAPNILAPRLWRWVDVWDHWDQCRLRSEVDGQLYQDVGVDVFLGPEDVLRILRERATVPERDFVVFCGTYVSVTGHIQTGRDWRVVLEDPQTGRSIEHSYTVDSLFDEIAPAYRVRLFRG